MTAEINRVMTSKDVEIPAAGVVAVKPDTAVALDAAVHLMVDEGAEILIAMRALLKPGPSIIMTGHDGHVLEMAFAALVADRAIVRVVQHEPLDHARPEGLCIGIID